MKNQLADSLVVSASTFIPPLPPKLTYEVQIKYRPSLPNNVKYWSFFENDEEINRFLRVVGEFAERHIDQENETMEECSQSKLKSEIDRGSIVQLPSNHIPKGLVPLEKLFNHNDVPYKLAKIENESTICKHNIGSPTHLKFINLSTHLSSAQNSEYCTLMKQFTDIFALEYSDLKTYDTNII